MIWNLTYCPASNQHYDRDPICLPWVAGDWLSPTAIITDFEHRFPGSRVVSLEPAEVAA